MPGFIGRRRRTRKLNRRLEAKLITARGFGQGRLKDQGMRPLMVCIGARQRTEERQHRFTGLGGLHMLLDDICGLFWYRRPLFILKAIRVIM